MTQVRETSLLGFQRVVLCGSYYIDPEELEPKLWSISVYGVESLVLDGKSKLGTSSFAKMFLCTPS